MNWYKIGFPKDDDGRGVNQEESSERAERVASMCQEGLGASSILDGEQAFLESVLEQALGKKWVSEKQEKAVAAAVDRIDKRHDASYYADPDDFRWDRDFD